jgi:hypothetical protein
MCKEILIENNGINEIYSKDIVYCGGYLFEFNKKCIIFNKEFDFYKPIEVEVLLKNGMIEIERKLGTNYTISEECILKINQYMKWISDCKYDLIKFYTKLYNDKYGKYGEITIEEMLEEEWYEEMFVQDIKIFIEKNGEISSTINCMFIKQEIKTEHYSVQIKTEENKISSMNIIRV